MQFQRTAYSLTFVPITSLLLLLFIPQFGFILIPLLMLAQCVSLLFTTIEGKASIGFHKDAKPLLWINGIALAIYPLLLILMLYSLFVAFNGIQP